MESRSGSGCSSENTTPANCLEGQGVGDVIGTKRRKPYVRTSVREVWTPEEHSSFLEALALYRRDWNRIERHVGTKTKKQIQSHAQKYFKKVLSNRTGEYVPKSRAWRRKTERTKEETISIESRAIPTAGIHLSPLSVQSLADTSTNSSNFKILPPEFQRDSTPMFPALNTVNIYPHLPVRSDFHPRRLVPEAVPQSISQLSPQLAPLRTSFKPSPDTVTQPQTTVQNFAIHPQFWQFVQVYET